MFYHFNVLLTFQLIGRKKLKRLALLAKQADISICVDDIGNIHEINDMCAESSSDIGLVVEVNVGQDRFAFHLLFVTFYVSSQTSRISH